MENEENEIVKDNFEEIEAREEEEKADNLEEKDE